MPHFFIDTLPQEGEIVEIRGAHAKHIARVLRLQVHDHLTLTSGSGSVADAEIVAMSLSCVSARIIARAHKKRALIAPILAQALLKHDKMEWVIQKSVELGISRIIPFSSDRTIPSALQDHKRHTRWNAIATAAAEQSGLAFRPEVTLPLSFQNLLEQHISGTSFLFWEEKKGQSIHAITPSQKEVPLLIIGPEGGFTSDEVGQAEKRGVSIISLGDQILRAETAAIVAVSLAQFLLGNLSPQT